MNFGHKLRQLRESKDLTLHQLADNLNISKPVLWQYETKKTVPSAEVIKKIAVFFNVTSDYLIFDELKKGSNNLKSLNIEFLKRLDNLFAGSPKYKSYVETTVDILLEKNKK